MTEGGNGFHAGPDHLPTTPGAYVLLLGLEAPLDLRLRGEPAIQLAAGRVLGAWIFPGEQECRLVARLARRNTAAAPVLSAPNPARGGRARSSGRVVLAPSCL